MANPVDLSATADTPQDGSMGDSASLGGVDHQPVLQLTHADLSRLLQEAVQAGAAQAQAGGHRPAAAVPVNVPADWDDREFYLQLVNHMAHGWYHESEHQAALAYIDKTYPAPVEEV